MKVQSLHIPPPNDQKEDPTWNWHGVVIGGNSQCQGNSNEDCIKAIAQEFNINELKNINTKNYYAMFVGIWHGNKQIFPNRASLMDFRNHAWFMNTLFKASGIPVIATPAQINNDPTVIHTAIERTKRPVSVGTLLSQSGHWISIHGSDSVDKIFDCNDPFGSHPYRKEQKGGGHCQYSWEYLHKNTIRRIITFEDRK